MIARNYRYSHVALILLFFMKYPFYIPLLLANVVPLGAQFSPAELTKNEIIDLYKVPIDTRPASKFEWKFKSPRYVRLIVEESNARGESWKQRGVYLYNLSVTKAVLIYMLEDRQVSGPEGNMWSVSMRIGGELEARKGWTGSTFLMPGPPGPYTCESKWDDPERFCVWKFADRQIRFRMESSDKAYSD